jgi:hypothetical protein
MLKGIHCLSVESKSKKSFFVCFCDKLRVPVYAQLGMWINNKLFLN